MASQQIRQKYKVLGQLVNRLQNEKQKQKGWHELRTKFRSPLKEGQTIDDRLKEADDRASFLRIVTPKDGPANQSGKWVYKDGKPDSGRSTVRDAHGRVISNWSGKNLDPESVKRHSQQLKRAGFRNNSHAKGMF